MNPDGTPDTAFNGTVALSNTNGAISGQTTAQAVNGLARFASVTVDESLSDNRIVASSDNFTAGISNRFVVLPGDAAFLLETSCPSTVAAGAPFNCSFAMEDKSFNVVTSFNGTATVQLAGNSNGATLGGTLTVPVAKGVATFQGLSIDKTGTGYYLLARVGGMLTNTGQINVLPADAASQLVISSQPASNVAAGDGVGFTVAAEDSLGNVATTFNGTVTVSDGGSHVLASTAAVKGVATFSNVILTQAGLTSLTATSGDLSAATTTVITVNAQPATQLVVSNPSGNVLNGSTFGLSVAAVDQYGNLDPTFNGQVTLSLGPSPSGAALIPSTGTSVQPTSLATNATNATLSGTSPQPAVGGIATFSDVTLNSLGQGCTDVPGGWQRLGVRSIRDI